MSYSAEFDIKIYFFIHTPLPLQNPFTPSQRGMHQILGTTDVRDILYVYNSLRSCDSSVSIATGYGLDDQGGGCSSPGRVKNVHFFLSFRPALESTQPPIKWVLVALSRG
jgi:hypothetical protein